MGELLLAAGAGFVVALLCTPVGVSGAVLLLPAQTNLLGLAGPAVSSTNLLFNVVSTPGGLTRFGRTAWLVRSEVVAVLVVAVPAAVGGALLRVTVLLGTITGLGGLAGSLLGARLQPRLDERLLTGVLAVLVTAVAAVQLLRG